MQEQFKISGLVKRFTGQNGWHYVELDDDLSKSFRPLIKDLWPALIRSEFEIGDTIWKSSIMPIKDGPMFIALPARVRKAESVSEGDSVTISFRLLV